MVLTTAAAYCVEGFVCTLMITVGVKMLTGAVNTRGLLRSKSVDGVGKMSPARLQLLLFTLGTAGTYLERAIQGRASGTLPDVPKSWLLTLGGSHGLYLGAKAMAFLTRASSSVGAGNNVPD